MNPAPTRTTRTARAQPPGRIMNTARKLLIFAFAAGVTSTVFAQLRAPSAPPTPPPAPAAPAASQPIASPTAAQGQQDPLTREFRDCIQKAQTAMQARKADDPAAIHLCLTAEVKRQDGKLASASQRMAKALPPEGKKRLDAANADWRRFRGSECNFIADENGPPPGNLENANCKLRMTTIRALEMDSSANMLARQDSPARAQQEAPAPPTPPSAGAPAAVPGGAPPNR